MTSGLDDLPSWLERQPAAALGSITISLRAMIDRTEAAAAEALRRMDKSGEYQADGAVNLVDWLRANCKLSAGAATERVGVARQLEQLPQTEKAFANGELGYQHVAVMARTAEHVGVAPVQKAEATLLKAAKTMDPGRFNGLAKDFEHRVDAVAALAEANRAHERRYFHVGEPTDGLVRLDGLLDAEGGAMLRTALNAAMLPGKDDDRTPGQRRADALVDLCRCKPGSADGSGPRPQLVIRASLDTLLGLPGAPAGELETGGSVPAETVRRIACDAAITRITGRGELEAEISRASRSAPPSTRRALAARDRHCVAGSCDRPPQWTDCHHLQHWTQGGPTTLANLVLLCRRHHRMVHEEGWGLRRAENRPWALVAPVRLVSAQARSA